MKTHGLLFGGMLMTALVVLVAPGCGEPSIQDLCQRACDCQADGCTPEYMEDCTGDLGQLKEEAEEAECGTEFNALLVCFDEELVCEDGFNPAIVGCGEEFSALGTCQGAGTDACQLSRDAIVAGANDCGVEPIVETAGECTEALAARLQCQDNCLAGATCESLSDPADPERADLDACLATCD